MRLLLVITLRTTHHEVIKSRSSTSVQHRSHQAGRWNVVILLDRTAGSHSPWGNECNGDFASTIVQRAVLESCRVRNSH